MKENFDESLVEVLKHEGGYVDHPRDPGGATNRGITTRVYRSYRRRKGLPLRSVRHITAKEVRDIYKAQYWDRVEGDHLPSGVDYAVFDYAVNSGTTRGEKELQRVVGTRVDGQIGSVTLAATEAMDARVVIQKLCDRRMSFLRRLPHWNTFRRGWTARVKGVRSHALGMVRAPVEVPSPLPPEDLDRPHWVVSIILALTGLFSQKEATA